MRARTARVLTSSGTLDHADPFQSHPIPRLPSRLVRSHTRSLAPRADRGGSRSSRLEPPPARAMGGLCLEGRLEDAPS
ncbi:hypothetical protein [Natronolimnobius baerhuensis]|uniref:hypothetical protein n=1 Tax=Natronolimnobius baerhuensis TaxID=253108 RepID=UPI001124D1FF|nr:hypothetical protein [Natronolimnobius baerhuensis]